MADPNSMLGEVGSQIMDKIFGGILWFGLALLLIGVIAFFMWWFLIYKKKFNIIVKVISARAKDRDYIIFDKAAILVDRKTGTKYFRIWGLKLDLPAPDFNVLQNTSSGDYLELYRTSEDTIYFLTSPVIDKTKVIKHDGKAYSIAAQKLKQFDPDMAFWNVKRKTFNKKMFDTESLFFKLLPYFPIIFGSVLMIFVIYVLMDKLPAILAELKNLAAELNSLKRAEIVQGLIPLLIYKWKKL